jgi:hypothetical protein
MRKSSDAMRTWFLKHSAAAVLRSQEMECDATSHTPRAPIASPDSDERATNSLRSSSLANGGRSVA